MADQEQKKYKAEKDEEAKKAAEDAEAKTREGAATERGKKIKEDLDKLLDEIDDILEKNAEEFVKSYVQRGGE